MIDTMGAEPLAQPVECGDHHRGAHVARAAVAEIAHRRQAAEHRHSIDRVHRQRQQRSLVAQQHRRGGRRLPGERPMMRRSRSHRSGGCSSNTVENRRRVATIRSTDRSTSAWARAPDPPTASASAIARCWRNGISMSSPAVTDAIGSRKPKMKSEVTKPSHPHSSRRISVSRCAFWPHHSPLTELYALITDADPGGGDTLEVRQIDLVERPFVGRDVDGEPGVLHRVEREVLHARHHVHAADRDERRRHHPHVVRILAVGLLRPPPRRMPQQVHAHRTGVGGAAGSQLGADRIADAGLQGRGRSSRREPCSPGTPSIADDAATWPVREVDSRNAESLDVRRRPGMAVVPAGGHVDQAGPERRVAIETAEPLVDRHRCDERRCLGVTIASARTRAAASSNGVDMARHRHTPRRRDSREPAPATLGWQNADMPGAFLHPFAKPTRERFITIARGDGALLWDADGNELVDAMASLWYCQVGHGRREIADVVADQISTIEAYSCFDPFTNGPADELAERIASLTPIPDARVFFAGSGSESVDSAMKLARLAHVQAGHPERRLIISRVRGYHGTNYGGTSAQGIAAQPGGLRRTPRRRRPGAQRRHRSAVGADGRQRRASRRRDHRARAGRRRGVPPGRRLPRGDPSVCAISTARC